MNKIMDHIAYLSQEIGARPANTEEEQRAATYIQEVLEREAHLPAEIEEFNCNSHAGYARAIYCAVTVILVALSLVVPVMTIPALIGSVLMAGCLVAETLGHPVLSRFFMRGISQNVVAKYEPPRNAEGAPARRRKVIVVAHYDSGKVRRDLQGPAAKALAPLQMASFVAMIAVPVILLIHDLFFLHATGAAATGFMVLVVAALIVCALPIVSLIASALAPYTDAANSNASGVGVMLETARLVGNNMVGTDARSPEATMHSAEEAIAAGLVPEGTSISYEAPSIEDFTPEESLIAAKAAIAAMTGAPMSQRDMDIAKNLVNLREKAIAEPTAEEMTRSRKDTAQALSSLPADTLAAAQASQDEEVAAVEEPVQAVEEEPAVQMVEETTEPSVPDWYTKAKASAKRKDDGVTIHRSRYAITSEYEDEDFLTAAQAIMHGGAEEPAEDVIDDRILELQADIMATQAPHLVRNDDEATQQLQVEAADTTATLDAVATTDAPTQAFEAVEPQAEKPQVVVDMPVQPVATPMGYDRMYSVTDRDPSQTVPVMPMDPAATQPAPIVSADREVLDYRQQIATAQAVDAAEGATIGMPVVGQATTAMPAVQAGNLDLDALRNQQEMPEQVTRVIPTRAAAVQATAPQGIAFTPGSLNQAAIPDPLAPAADMQEFKQRAPLAFTGEDRNNQAAKDLLMSSLPSVLPEIAPADETSPAGAVSVTSSFAPLETSGAGTSVGDELLADVDPEDIYVDDADDTVFEDEFTETGAFAGPGYVEMPQSRLGKFFGRFSRKKKKDEESSASDWLGVDDDFDARKVGKERGGWESFRDEDDWQGGAFSNRHVVDEDRSAGFTADGYSDAVIAEGQDVLLGADTGEETAVDAYEMHEEAMQDIYSFASGDLNIEVWFVALGSELAENSGIKAFLANHADEMRGAVLVNLESMGGGPLCYAEKEGFIKQTPIPARMKRFIKQAVHTSGVRIDPAQISWRESAASIAAKHRMQAVTLAGMDGVKPAGFGDAHDDAESIDLEALEYNTRYVVELLKAI